MRVKAIKGDALGALMLNKIRPTIIIPITAEYTVGFKILAVQHHDHVNHF